MSIRAASVTIAVTLDEIDVQSGPAFAEQLSAGLRQLEADSAGSGAELVVDLSGVRFLDSTGIRGLIEVERAALDRGQRVVVTGAAGVVRRSLEVTGVLEHLGRERRNGRP